VEITAKTIAVAKGVCNRELGQCRCFHGYVG